MCDSNTSKILKARKDVCVQSSLHQVLLLDCIYFLFVFFFILNIAVSLWLQAPSIALFVARIREWGLSFWGSAYTVKNTVDTLSLGTL